MFWQLENFKYKDYDWINGVFYVGVFVVYEMIWNEDIFQVLLDMG